MTKKRKPGKKAQAKTKQKGREYSKAANLDRKRMTGVIIFVLVAVATLALAFFGVLYNSHKVSAIWIMFGSVVVYALAACIYWQQQVAPESARTDAIRLKINGAFVTESDKIPVFFAKYSTGSGSAITPVPLVFGATITNAGSTPVQLDSLSLSAKSGLWGRWMQLISVPTAAAEVYWAPDPKQALLARLTRMDSLLAGKPLAPNIPASGWMFFQYPPSFETRSGERVHWRFNAEDSAGNKYEFPLIDDDLASHKSLKPNAPAMSFDGTKDDLTAYPSTRPSLERK